MSHRAEPCQINRPRRRTAAEHPDHPRGSASRVGIVAVLLLLAGVAHAEAPTSAEDYEGTLTVTLENDLFTNSDNDYTNGIGISWTSNALRTYDHDAFPAKWGRFWSFLPFVEDQGFDTYASWTLSQEMYTPSDISDPTPPLDDQPYAGILLLDSLLHARRGRWGYTYILRLGVVGPASFADESQTWLHKRIGSPEPRGWHTQLPNEPVLNVNMTASYALDWARFGDSGEWRIVSVGGAGIGNYFTGLNLGLYADIGWNLPDSAATAPLRGGFGGASTIGSGPSNTWSIAFYGGLGGFAVAHFLPLDGTVFRDSRSVDSDPLVGTASAGLTIRHGGFVLNLGRTYFTETFKNQDQATEFGTVGFSWYF